MLIRRPRSKDIAFDISWMPLHILEFENGVFTYLDFVVTYTGIWRWSLCVSWSSRRRRTFRSGPRWTSSSNHPPGLEGKLYINFVIFGLVIIYPSRPFSLADPVGRNRRARARPPQVKSWTHHWSSTSSERREVVANNNICLNLLRPCIHGIGKVKVFKTY